MKIKLLMPGFGFSKINSKILTLQPWNYIYNIAITLQRQGYNPEIIIYNSSIDNETFEKINKEKIKVRGTDSLKPSTEDVFIFPIGIGFLLHNQKFLNKTLSSNIRRIGILTTPILQLYDLLKNYAIIKKTRTEVTASTVLYENLLLRLLPNIICKYIEKLIVPSKDYQLLLSRILKCGLEYIHYMPPVEIPKVENDEKENNFEISYFGPYSEERGIISLLQAMNSLNNNYLKNIRLNLFLRDLGSRNIGLLKNLLKNKNLKLHLEVGFLEKEYMYKKLKKSDIILLPYRIISSTLPLAYLEALMLVNPIVISTNIPSIDEHLSKYMPYRLKPTFSLKDLGKVIVMLYENAVLYNKIRLAQYKYTNYLEKRSKNQKIVI